MERNENETARRDAHIATGWQALNITHPTGLSLQKAFTIGMLDDFRLAQHASNHGRGRETVDGFTGGMIPSATKIRVS